MISTEEISAQITGRLSNIKPVIPGVLRGERIDTEGHPYAIYYFALSNNLKDWADHLEQRQDELIGPSYFKTSGDLRWNHYLYLLASKEVAQEDTYNDIKRVIESDISYARKFVVTGEELPEALKCLDASKIEQQELKGPDVVGRWTQRLLQAQLGVVLDQHSVIETVRKISKGTHSPATFKQSREHIPRILQPLTTKFLDTVELVHFREWPGVCRVFESLGTVNLIVGSNGTGKTTLLEAIEYFYCQDNARTSSPPNAHIKAKLKGMTTWQETRSNSKSAEAKQRNLDWYGQRDLRGSTLHNSFSRFNFLSTDEAAMLGQKNAKVSFEDMLSQLVAGPQAAELWDHISRLGKPLEAERSSLQMTIKEAKKRKIVLEELIKTLSVSPRASDPDLSTLVEDLSRLGWKNSVSRDSVASEAVPTLTRASSLARELMIMKLGMKYVSHDAIVEARNDADAKMLEVEKNLKQLSEIESNVSHVAVAKQALQKVIQNIDAIKIAQRLNAFMFVSKLDSLQRRLSELRILAGEESLPNEVPVWMQELKVPLFDAVESIRQQSEIFAVKKADLESRLTSLRETQSATTSMLVEIRALAKELLSHSTGHTDCPVCSTVFEVGELQRRLEQVISQTSTDKTGPVLDELMAVREQISLAETKLEVLNDLVTYARRSGKEQLNAIPQKVLFEFYAQHEDLERLEGQLADAAQHVSGLSTSGLNYESINALHQLANNMGIDVMRQDAIDKEWARMQDKLKELDAILDQHTVDRRSLTSKIFVAILGIEEVTESIDDIVKEFRNRHTQLHSAFMLISELQQFLTIEGDADVSSIAPLLDSAKASAERFAKALESEIASRTSEVSAKEQLEKNEKQIADYQATEKRVIQAIDVLSALEKEDSLIAATDAELLSVQTETDEIFRRVHSPHEYGVRRDAKAPLYRLDKPNQAITLRDVSTGQRAAFVLSVFLAMNAKLKTAPPVLLFDDPVAHIDDFNSLSFLDHLRDIALDGKRQVFYATADSRMAGLFEHKFSFMGDKFRRFDLVR